LLGPVYLAVSVIVFFFLTNWLKGNKEKHSLFWLMVGVGMMLYSAVPQFGFVIYGDAAYVGHTKGFEITILDIAAASYLAAKLGEKRDFRVPFRNLMIAYFAIAVVLIPSAVYYTASGFFALQLLRMYLFYKALMLACIEEKNMTAFLKGLAFGMFGQMLIVFYQRTVGGMVQPPGTLGHQNLLGFVSNVVLTVSITAILMGDRPKSRWISAVTALATSAVTGSRGAVIFAFATLTGTYFHSLYHGASSRKLQIGFVGAALSAVLLPIAINNLMTRFELEGNISGGYSQFAEYDEREAYKKAALAMALDKPFGVGANNFVLVANAGGYYKDAGVLASFRSLSGHVHNIYYLTMAELGFPGLFVLCALMLNIVWKGFSAAWRHKGTKEAEIAGGAAVGLLVCFLHSWVEWIIVTADAQYFVAVLLAILASRLIILDKQGALVNAATPVPAPVKKQAKMGPPLQPAPIAAAKPPVKRHFPRPGQRRQQPEAPKPQFE
jgi:O-antigen ligase